MLDWSFAVSLLCISSQFMVARWCLLEPTQCFAVYFINFCSQTLARCFTVTIAIVCRRGSSVYRYHRRRAGSSWTRSYAVVINMHTCWDHRLRSFCYVFLGVHVNHNSIWSGPWRPRTTAMVSIDGRSSAADDRDRDGKASRQCLTAEVDEIDSIALHEI